MSCKENWISLILTLQGFVGFVQAAYCSYETEDGHVRYTYCEQQCCEGEPKHYVEACCRSKFSSNVVIASGIAGLIAFAVLILCFLYFQCKRKLYQQARQSAISHYNSRIDGPHSNYNSRITGLHSRRNTVLPTLPTVTSQVEPPKPPPYDMTPPPYEQSIHPGRIYSSSTSTGQKAWTLPEEPPPAYTARNPLKT